MNKQKIVAVCALTAMLSACSTVNKTSDNLAITHEDHKQDNLKNATFCPAGSMDLELDLEGVALERVADIPLNYQGFNNIEGPVWHDGALYYSNIGSLEADENGFALSNQTTLWRWQPGQSPEVWLDDSQAGTNGLAVDFDGNLTAVRHLDGSIAKIDWKTKNIQIVANQYEDKRFNSPNDLTIAFDGSIYFSDPNWDTPNNIDRSTTQGGGAPRSQEVGQRIYRVSPEGIVTATAATELIPALRDKPNGIMLSLDQKNILVGSLNGVWSFDIEYGHLSNPKQILPTAIDGMGKDCAGNIYITTTRPIEGRENGQVVVVINKEFKEIGQLEVPGIHIVTNVAFGGEDGKTLFVTGLTDPMDGDKRRKCGQELCLKAGIYTTTVNIPGFPN